MYFNQINGIVILFETVRLKKGITVEPRLYEHQGTVKMRSPYPEFVLTSIICI